MKLVLRLLLVGIPAIPLLAAVPLVAAGPEFQYSNPGFQLFYWGIVSLCVMGLLAAPGYLAALFIDDWRRRFSDRKRQWINISLIVGAACSLVAIPLTFFALGYLVIFPLLTLGACLWLLVASSRQSQAME